MRSITFADLDNLDVSLVKLSAIAPSWPDSSITRYAGSGRPENMLFYLICGRWDYRSAGCEPFAAADGDILFMPSGCCYESRCHLDACTGRSTGICLKFTLQDENGDELTVGDVPLLLAQDKAGRFRPLFEQGLHAILRGVGGKMSAKALAFRLLDELAVSQHRESFASGEFPMIYPAVRQLDHHPNVDLSIKELADLCYMSETTFRRKFHQYSGLAPLAYRNTIRIRKADELLASGLYTVDATAEALGFTDASHFCKTYKRLRGHSPKSQGLRHYL